MSLAPWQPDHTLLTLVFLSAHHVNYCLPAHPHSCRFSLRSIHAQTSAWPWHLSVMNLPSNPCLPNPAVPSQTPPCSWLLTPACPSLDFLFPLWLWNLPVISPHCGVEIGLLCSKRSPVNGVFGTQRISPQKKIVINSGIIPRPAYKGLFNQPWS